MDGASLAMKADLYFEVERFITREARLLDDRRFDEWLALFEPDARYWVPMAWQQSSPVGHVSLINEDLMQLTMRIRRLLDPRTASQQPPSRTCHQMTNTELEAVAPDENEVRARSAFSLLEYRRDEQRLFGGFVTHELIKAGDGFRIKSKRVDLLNCDSDHGHLRFGAPF